MKSFYLFVALAIGSVSFLSAQSINAVKIGSASNAYSTYLNSAHALSHLPGTGTNGGSLAFIHRENANLYGTAGSSGNIRYAISTNGGTSWTSELGRINPGRSFLARYPQVALFDQDTSATSTGVNDLALCIVTPTLDLAGTAFEGHLHVTVDSAAFPGFAIRNETYAYRSGTTNFTNRIGKSLVERVPGEFFYVNFQNNARDLFVYRGTYAAGTGRVVWGVDTTIATGFPAGTQQPQGNQIAFSPDGQTGYIAMTGDLTSSGNYSPIFLTTTNGGNTWSSPEEVDMTLFPTLLDTFRAAGIFAPTLTLGELYTGGTVIPTGLDLTVDANGNPHLFALVGNNSSAVNYTMTQEKFMLLDFTKDSLGNWVGKFVADKNTKRATIGNTGVVNGSLIFESWLQVTRNATGDKIFYSWNDTDTTLRNWTPAQGNNAPDLLGRAYDLTTNLMSPVTNWTANDTTWAGKVLTPMVPNTAMDFGTSFRVPTAVYRMESPTRSLLDTVSYWYFPNIIYQAADFTDSVLCFPTCSGLPLAYTLDLTDAICGNSNGSASVIISGGTNPGPYTISWSTGATGVGITGLLSGNYGVTIVDGYNCETKDSARIQEFPGPMFDSTTLATDVACFGGNTGTAKVVMTGGTPPYTYFWTTGATSDSVSGLIAGTIRATVTDSLGCQTDTTFIISQPADLALVTNFTEPLCFGDSTGTAGVFASGGTPSYSYSWSNGDSTANLLNLPSGGYTVTVTDTNGCSKNASISVTQPRDIVASPTVVNASCFGAANGSASLAVTGGTAPYQYQWSNGTVISSLNNVTAGTYTVTISDFNNCRKEDTVIISEPTEIVPNATVTPVGCAGDANGEILLAPSGGTPPYTYQWVGGQTANFLNNLAAGTYVVTITDGNNCTKTEPFVLRNPAPLTANTTITPDDGTGNGTASVNVTGGTPPYDFLWNNGQTGQTVTGLFVGGYIVTITDAGGCVISDTIFVGLVNSVEERIDGLQEFLLFPNPASSQIQVEASFSGPTSVRLVLTDYMGRTVWRQYFPAAVSTSVAIPVSGLADGLYQLQLVTPHGTGSKSVRIKH
ncbi:MAG: hypothetical protein AAGI38_10295 [Bacteroidota bacterium]